VTDAVSGDVREWQSRYLERSYAIVYLDALRVNSRQDGKSCQKSVYVALGVNFEGKKEVLGYSIAATRNLHNGGFPKTSEGTQG
jgi:transposase-like protein